MLNVILMTKLINRYRKTSYNDIVEHPILNQTNRTYLSWENILQRHAYEPVPVSRPAKGNKTEFANNNAEML